MLLCSLIDYEWYDKQEISWASCFYPYAPFPAYHSFSAGRQGGQRSGQFQLLLIYIILLCYYIIRLLIAVMSAIYDIMLICTIFIISILIPLYTTLCSVYFIIIWYSLYITICIAIYIIFKSASDSVLSYCNIFLFLYSFIGMNIYITEPILCCDILSFVSLLPYAAAQRGLFFFPHGCFLTGSEKADSHPVCFSGLFHVSPYYLTSGAQKSRGSPRSLLIASMKK